MPSSGDLGEEQQTGIPCRWRAAQRAGRCGQAAPALQGRSLPLQQLPEVSVCGRLFTRVLPGWMALFLFEPAFYDLRT